MGWVSMKKIQKQGIKAAREKRSADNARSKEIAESLIKRLMKK
jgi:hypothetical protein